MSYIQKKCCFPEIFSGKDGAARPVVYSRSDYDGTRWWTTWNRENSNDKEANKVPFPGEINDFQNTLMSRPEMRNLETMKEYCLNEAEPTSDPTEFNLYSETEHHYVWMRLITRFKDYNLYVRFYAKDAGNAE